MQALSFVLFLLVLIGCQAQASTSSGPKPSSRQMTPATATVAKPIVLTTEKKVLDLTDDIPQAERQAAAYPNDPEAQFLLAIAYSRSPYVEKALSVLQRTKRLMKGGDNRLKTMEALIADYETALNARPTDTRILYRLAFGYYLKGLGLQKYQQADSTEVLSWIHKAETTMRRVIELDPMDIWARDYLGFVMAEEGTQHNQPALVQQAMDLWQESLQTNPVNPPAYWFLGTAYLKQGNLREATQFAEKGIQARQELSPTPQPSSK